ncbi:MAG: ribokinase [Pararhizobium sp.]
MSRVFVFGNATIDLVLAVETWPKPGETVLAEGLTRSPGGKGLNQAVAAARLGANVRLVAPIGDDADAAYLRRFLAVEPGIETAWISCRACTDISTIWVSRRGENVIVSSADCARAVQPEDAEIHLEALGAGDILLLQGNLRPETTLAAARIARAREARLLLNTAPVAWDMAEVLPLADVIVSNEPEARMLTSCEGKQAAIALKACSRGAAIVTRGPAGAALADADGVHEVPAPSVEVVDTSGAGDMLVGTLAHGLASGASLLSALRCSVALASLCVTRPGTIASFPTAEGAAHPYPS